MPPLTLSGEADLQNLRPSETQVALALFGTLARRCEPLVDRLAHDLPRARILRRPEEHLALSFLHTAVAAFAGLGSAAFLVLFLPTGLPAAPVLVLPLLFALGLFVFKVTTPARVAAVRARRVDANLPYALNYVATMAAAGMSPERIFRSLAAQPVYAEVAEEADLIARDLSVLGLDLKAAFRAAAKRTPSPRMQSFLQGAITTLSTGDDLDRYFLAKSQQYAAENRQRERRFIEGLGVLSESYVTVVVAAPIFVIVLLSVLIVLGGQGDSMLMLGYLFGLVLVPVAQMAFGAVLSMMTPEV